MWNIPPSVKVYYMISGPEDDYEVICEVVSNEHSDDIVLRLVEDFKAPDGTWSEKAGAEFIGVSWKDIVPVEDEIHIGDFHFRRDRQR